MHALRAYRLLVTSLRVLEMVGCRNEGGWTMAEGRYAGTVRAPDFPPEMDWLNVERPLSLADLRGRLVILDFWTSG
jgi:hypothetical protein